MSQQDEFAGGFLLGTLVGGIVGGVLGALVASGKLKELVSSEEAPLLNSDQPDDKGGKAKKRSLKPQDAQQVDIEAARRSLEDKIAQLNDAIDDVRQKLGGVNGTSSKSSEPSASKEA
ncbi:hypothetical protein [Leptothermofonsia sp. ETS-13]|uniref:hypothetical protein n=1 Tax=Leptothermofonsia sp. ETS-13 TaxID=3035696 RepID=UPI003B9E20F1